MKELNAEAVHFAAKMPLDRRDIEKAGSLPIINPFIRRLISFLILKGPFDK